MRPSAFFGNHRWVAVPLITSAHGLASVSRTALLVLGALVAQADEDGAGTYSGAELAVRIGKSKKTIENALAQLGKHPDLTICRGRFRLRLGPPVEESEPFKRDEIVGENDATPGNEEDRGGDTTPGIEEFSSLIPGVHLLNSGSGSPGIEEFAYIHDEKFRKKEAQRQKSSRLDDGRSDRDDADGSFGHSRGSAIESRQREPERTDRSPCSSAGRPVADLVSDVLRRFSA